MASCWSCGQDPGPDAFCAACGKVQPARGEDPFATLGLPRSFAVDADALERRYRALQRKLHPDRFALKPAAERRASLERATAVNEAYRVVKDPVRRAEALLALAGVALPTEGSAASRAVDPELLAEVLELREELDDARRARDLARVETLAGQIRGRQQATLDEIAVHLGAGTGDGALPLVHRLRYFARFLDEASAIQEASA